MPSRLAYLIALTLLFASASAHVQTDVRARKVPLRGVNLGGWLVAEHWMTQNAPIWTDVPAAARSQGEYHAMKSLGPKGQAAFDRHRSTFITEADVAAVAAAKFNTVRVPVGYWIQGCDHIQNDVLKKQCSAFAKNGLSYLDTLIKKWALKHNVAVLISLHAAPGSQNGNDHSGVVDGIHWGDKASVAATKAFAHFLVDRYKNDPAFLGLGLLNEPSSRLNLPVLKQFYTDMYRELRLKTDCLLVFMPQLQLQLTGQLEDLDKSMKNVWVEWHPYLIWGYETTSEDDILNKKGIDYVASRIRAWKGHPLLFGEWSFVTPTGTFTTPATFQPFLHKLLGTMNTAGWTYWSWKIDGDDTIYGGEHRWSVRQMLQRLPPVAHSGTAPYTELTFESGAKVTVVASILAVDTTWVASFGPPPVERWAYDPKTKQLVSSVSGLCLDASYDARTTAVIKGYPCQSNNYNQKWTFKDRHLLSTAHNKCLAAATASSMTLVACKDAAPNQTLRSSVKNVEAAEYDDDDEPLVRIFLNGTTTRLILYQNQSVELRPQHHPDDSGLWRLRDGVLQHHTSGRCLASDLDAKQVTLGDCNEDDVRMQWTFANATGHWLLDSDCLDAQHPTTPTVVNCSRSASQTFVVVPDATS